MLNYQRVISSSTIGHSWRNKHRFHPVPPKITGHVRNRERLEVPIPYIFGLYILGLCKGISQQNMYGLIWYSTSILGSWNSHWTEVAFFPGLTLQRCCKSTKKCTAWIVGGKTAHQNKCSPNLSPNTIYFRELRKNNLAGSHVATLVAVINNHKQSLHWLDRLVEIHHGIQQIQTQASTDRRCDGS